jgi:5-methylcytosine-specific restriction protein A
MIFSSGAIGALYGYEDSWSDNKTIFRYTGEGQEGDMEWVRGNLAIKNHAQDGKRLLLFFKVQKESGIVQFDGDFELVDFEQFQTPDVTGEMRLAIRFVLKRVEGVVSFGSSQPASEEVNSHQQTKRNRTRQYRKPNTTERTGLITSRVGQGYYRQEIVAKFESRCAVTGLGIAEVLIASHIVPWRDANDDERVDENNGILLSPVYDALFDKYLIAFSDEGALLLSKQLSEDDVAALGINRSARIKVTEGMLPFLRRHRARLKCA